jgi:hypothetical protein
MRLSRNAARAHDDCDDEDEQAEAEAEAETETETETGGEERIGAGVRVGALSAAEVSVCGVVADELE